MAQDYEQYKKDVTADIENLLHKKQYQPVLFIGSGFSKRYAGGPSWEELMRLLAEKCPLIEKDFAYYMQGYGRDLKKVAKVFVDKYYDWAWGSGRGFFPDSLFNDGFEKDIYLKYMTAEIVKERVNIQGVCEGGFSSEVGALKSICAHAIITTNYDCLIEELFPRYERIVGQKIIRENYFSIGELFKIHGCCTDPKSIVLTENDYSFFNERKRYLGAKLMTYFVEHPLVFIGYGAGDENIKSILFDISMMLDFGDSVVDNIYTITWCSSIDPSDYPSRERVIPVSEGREVRVKNIVASSFDWVYRAFGSLGSLENVDMKLLRSLFARTVDLVRADIPRKHVEIDFKHLESAVRSGEDFAKVLGVTWLSDSSKVNLMYRYSLTQVGEALGFCGWNKANDLLKRINKENGVDIKTFDNAYHISIKTGSKSSSVTHKYSEKAIELLKKVRDGCAYELDVSRS